MRTRLLLALGLAVLLSPLSWADAEKDKVVARQKKAADEAWKAWVK